MLTKNYDVVVIGSGPSAKSVAEAARKQSKTVALIEEREFGGTCALRGCNPKKVYTNAASLVDQVRHADGKLIRTKDAGIRWSDLLKFKQEFTQPVIEGSRESIEESGIDTFHGRGTFASTNSIFVVSPDGDALHTLAADRIVLGTGAMPRPLEFPGSEHVIHSDDFLTLSDLPKRIAFIGGGYISMEFGCVAAQYGSQVVIVERGDRVLQNFDADMVKTLTQWCEGNGMTFRTGDAIDEVIQTIDGAYHVIAGGDGMVADLVVHGAGRVANIDSLDLVAGNVDYSDRGITVDKHLRSPSNPHVFATGDCADNGSPALTPMANEDAEAVAANLFADQPTETPQNSPFAAVAFTSPPIAMVGLSESDARQRCKRLIVSTRETSTWGSIRKTGLHCAGYKVLIDEDNDTILGAHLLGPHADEQINLFALAITHGLTRQDLMRTRFAYPTHGADLRRMLFQ